MADITIVFMGFINQQTSLGGTILQQKFHFFFRFSGGLSPCSLTGSHWLTGFCDGIPGVPRELYTYLMTYASIHASKQKEQAKRRRTHIGQVGASYLCGENHPFQGISVGQSLLFGFRLQRICHFFGAQSPGKPRETKPVAQRRGSAGILGGGSTFPGPGTVHFFGLGWWDVTNLVAHPTNRKWVITCYNPSYKWINPTYPM